MTEQVGSVDSESRRMKRRSVNQPDLQRQDFHEINVAHKGGWRSTAEAFVREDKKDR